MRRIGVLTTFGASDALAERQVLDPDRTCCAAPILFGKYIAQKSGRPDSRLQLTLPANDKAILIPTTIKYAPGHIENVNIAPIQRVRERHGWLGL
jgi:hypothetical protein